MPATVVLIFFSLVAFLVSEWLLKDEKYLKIRIIVITLLMVISGVFSFYDNNKPISEEDSFCFSKSLFHNATLSAEGEYLQYGVYVIMTSLESVFQQSWLPPIKRTEKAIYIEPNLEKKGKVIDKVKLREIFEANQFIEKIGYYRLSIPPMMRIERKPDEKRFGSTVATIEFDNKWVRLSIVLSYLPPENMLYGKLYYQEKWPIVFFSSKREEYGKWYSLLDDKFKSIHVRNKEEKNVLDSIHEQS